jgi:hypothetical protein
MGTKDRIKTKGHKEALNIHKKLINQAKPIIETLPQIKKDAPKPVIFSDSIILVSNDSSQEALNWILAEAQAILYIAINECVPINGAIAFGEYTSNPQNSIHFGQPLIDAFELQKKLPLYGVTLHHTMEKPLEESDKDYSHYIVKYHYLNKSGKISQYLVDWTPNADALGKNPQELVKKLHLVVPEKYKDYVDNTLEFVNWVLEKKQK